MQIKMLTGQEGPEISRANGQVLTIGVDVDAAEAQRLIDADFAEPVAGAAVSAPAATKAVRKAPAKAAS